LRINADLVTAFTTVPLALLGGLGLLCAALGGVTALIGLAQRQASVIGVAMAATLLIVGAVFIAAGVLGQYLGRVYERSAGTGAGYVLRAGPRRERQRTAVPVAPP
jgi:hypothetical protein